MSLITLKEAMIYAEENNCAIGSFNAVNLDMARGIIEAAEELQIPVVISLAEVHFPMAPLRVIGPLLVRLAKESTAPIVIHLDHGVEMESIKESIRIGFSSVMFDGSSLSFEKNIEITKEVVEFASEFGVSVEAEVGRLVTPETGSNEVAEQLDPKDFYTVPSKALEFVKETGVDALAIAYGTAHGLYKFEPNLDYDRVLEIKELTNTPLVMHGGSGLSKDKYLKSIDCGIRKINYYSDMAYNVANSIRDELNKNDKSYLHDVSQMTINYVREDVLNKMRLFSRK